MTDLYSPPWFAPRYAPVRHGSWELRPLYLAAGRGYWSGPVAVGWTAALIRNGQTWMSITPLEVESQEIGVLLARGHVAIIGFGMGWVAGATALQPGVTRVTIVERDPEVIAIHETLDLFAQLPQEARAKIRVVRADAFDWQPDAPVDLLMPDIWQPLLSDGRVEEVRRMQANIAANAVYFWGQELEIARHAAAAGRALDDAGIAATVAEFGLPLVGPETPGYAERVGGVAEAWMRGRWLPHPAQGQDMIIQETAA